jgi:hypothetical protein
MKTGVITGMFSMLCSTDGTSFCVFGTLLHRWHQFSCFRQSAPLMTPVFRVPKTQKLVPLVEQSIENMKTGAIGGAEYLKHKNWCHQWSRVPKT